MSNPEQANTEAQLHKLGQKVREGWGKTHPTPDKDLTFFKDAIREQWEKDHAAERELKPKPDAVKEQERKPEEPGMDR